MLRQSTDAGIIPQFRGLKKAISHEVGRLLSYSRNWVLLSAVGWT